MLPIVISAFLFRTLATRYILYVSPFVYAFIALGIIASRRFHRVWALAAAALTLAVSVLGLAYYFGTYQKSDYREMSHYLSERYAAGEDVLVIEAPRQHLLAKYYLGQDFPLEPVPNIPLPDYWPVTAPPVVPEEVDDQVLHYLDAYSSLWAAFSAESEVDGGEFLAKYITAVSYNLDCQFWLDVRLCRFISPHTVEPDIETQIAATFNDELILEHARIATDPQYVVLDEGRGSWQNSLGLRRPTRPSTTKSRCGWSTPPDGSSPKLTNTPSACCCRPQHGQPESASLATWHSLFLRQPAGAIRCRQESTIPPRLSPSPTLRPTAGCLRRRPSSWDSSKSMVQYGCCPPLRRHTLKGSGRTVLAAHKMSLSMHWTRRDWLALVLITCLAAALRLYQLGVVPPGFQFDEAFNAIDARSVLAGNRPLFLPANAGREVVYTYVQASLIRLFGLNVWTLRLASALFGTLAVPLAYVLLRVILRRDSRRIALFTSLTLAISLWHIHFSHYGIRVIMMPVIFSLAFGAYWLGHHAETSRRRIAAYAASGLLIGLSVWTHPTGRLAPLCAHPLHALAPVAQSRCTPCRVAPTTG